MTIDISDNNPRIIYTVAQGVTQTSFAVPFEFFADSDLNVYVDNVLKTITTHYSVSGGDGSTGTVTMSVTGATGGSKVAITRDVTIERVTDFTPGVEINRAALNTQLDTLTAIAADIKDQALRALRVQDSDITTSLEIPLASARANKIFAFDSTGAVSITDEIGVYKGNWAASTAYLERDLVKDTSTNNIFICLVAHTSSGSQPLTTNTDSAKWALIVDAASATTSASAAASSASAAASSASAASSSASAASSSASAAASSASAASSDASAAASSASAAAASYDSFDDRYLGAKSSDPTLDNDGNALLTGALYWNSSSNEMRVYSGSAWVISYLPASGYVTLTGSETLTNKDLSSGTNTFPSSLATLTGSQTLTNKTLTDPAITGTILEDIYTISDGAAFEIDPGNGSIQLITLGASRTPKATNFAAGESVTLLVDDGTAYTLTWTDSTFGSGGVVWKTDGGNAPTLNTSGYTVIVLFKVSTQVYGARVGDA
jgi:hypothetical protein